MRSCAAWIVRNHMTYQHTSVPVEGDRIGAIRSHNIHIEIDQPHSADGPARGYRAVGCVAGGTAQARVDVAAVPAPASGAHND